MLKLEPIGFVRNEVEESTDFSEVVSEIVVREDLVEGLFRIEESEEIDIIFWFDRSVGPKLKLHPKGDPANPLVGVFASRSPNRPNPIGVTRVKLLQVRGNIIVVKVSKPGQDLRFDVPTVGTNTIKTLKEARASVLALEADMVLMLDKPEVIAAADKAGIAIVAVKA